MKQAGNKTKWFILTMCVMNIVLIGVVIGLVATRESDDDDSGTRRKKASYSLEKDDENGIKDKDDEKTDKDERIDSADIPIVNQNKDVDLFSGLDRSKPQAVVSYYTNASYEFGKLKEECFLVENPKALNKLEVEDKSDYESTVVGYEIVQCKEYSYSKDVTKGIKIYIDNIVRGNSSYVEESAIVEVKPTEYVYNQTPYRWYVTLCKIDNEWYILDTISMEPDKIHRAEERWSDWTHPNHSDEDE